MAKYRIEVSATAEKQIRRLNKAEQIRVLRSVQALAEEPRPRGTRKLRGYENVYRIRVGKHRILYSIESRRLLIIVLKAGNRRDVYREP